MILLLMFNSDILSFLQVRDFEQSRDYQSYLERLKQQKDTDEIQKVDGVLDGRHSAKGVILFSSDLNRVQQVSIAKLPNFRGAFWAVGDTYDDCEVNNFKNPSI